jgi:hypothetical protein
MHFEIQALLPFDAHAAFYGGDDQAWHYDVRKHP